MNMMRYKPWSLLKETLINVHVRVGTPGFPRQGAMRSR